MGERTDRFEPLIHILAQGQVSLRKLIAELATQTRRGFHQMQKQFEATDRRMRETDERMNRTDNRINALLKSS